MCIVICPLCASSNVFLLERIAVATIITAWERNLEIDIRAELQGLQAIELWECHRCKLQYFGPGCVAGSSELYAKLEKFDWYYMEHKWEHDVALQDIRKSDRVLEVGCGIGDFVERLIRSSINAIGIETNPSAVGTAQKLKRPVYLRDLKDLLKRSVKFDVICAFQVLEHVCSPANFILQCLDLLEPKGRLLLCVPNSEGFIRFDQRTLLNHPPHHVTRWSERVFRTLPVFLPLHLGRICYEPLARYHLDWYMALQLERVSKYRFPKNLMQRLTRNLVLPMVLKTGAFQFLRGHSIYVSYQKTDGRLQNYEYSPS
jgi:SAM-dependent methyltransferase